MGQSGRVLQALQSSQRKSDARRIEHAPAAAAARLLADKRSGGLYLWVMEQNDRARQFYARAGAVEVECEKLSMPDGSMCMEMRCYWPDLKSLSTTGGNHLL